MIIDWKVFGINLFKVREKFILNGVKFILVIKVDKVVEIVR